jgi:hypothetical protein
MKASFIIAGGGVSFCLLMMIYFVSISDDYWMYLVSPLILNLFLFITNWPKKNNIQ